MFLFGSKVAYKKQPTQTRRNGYDHLLKIITVGTSGSGKSCLIMRFVDNRFSAMELSTIGVEFGSRVMQVGGKTFKLQIWDTTGQERFRSITRSYYRGAQGALVLFDVTSESSFEGTREYIDEVRKNGGADTSIVLVGAKTDQSGRVVSHERAAAYARRMGVIYREASSRSGEGVEEVFVTLVAQIGKTHNMEIANAPSQGVKMDCLAEMMDECVDQIDECDAEVFEEDDLFTRLSKLRADDGPRGGKRIAREKADANVFRLTLGHLGEEVPIVTGDPLVCGKCGVIVNKDCAVSGAEEEHESSTSSSEVAFEKAPPICIELQPIAEEAEAALERRGACSSAAGEISFWRCNHCAADNRVVDFEEAEIPREESVEYMLAPAPVSSPDDEYCNVVFCIDVSGSMCVTSELEGVSNIKGGAKRRREHAELVREFGMGVLDQYIPGQRRGVTMVSRLQCVQAAVEHHIERLARESPSTRVTLVTFSSDVTVIGDGIQEEHVIAGDKLCNAKALAEEGAQLRAEHCVADAKEKLLEKLWALEEQGGTALGPALEVGICIAGEKAGSSVILCTDGLANVGIGSLEGAEGDYSPYYTEFAEHAKLKGVSVSVVSLDGTECRLESLSIVCEQTAGTVQRLTPQELVNGFGLVDSKIIGYGVMALVMVHPTVQFRGEAEDEDHMRSWVVRDLGNVTADSVLSFSYGFRPKDQCDATAVDRVPFQVQLVYTKPNGMKCLRVASTTVGVTDDRDVAEQTADAEVVATHAALRAARLAKEGDYEGAQLETRCAKRFLERTGAVQEQVDMFATKMDSLDTLACATIMEDVAQTGESAMRDLARQRERIARRDDDAAACISKAKGGGGAWKLW